MTLDFDDKQFDTALRKAGDLVKELYREDSDRPVFAGKSAEEVIRLFDEPLPEESEPVEKVLDRVREQVFGTMTRSMGPRYFGYITGGGNQVAVLAEMIKASLNQNNLKWHSSPVSTEMERLVMRWVAEFTGYPIDSAGVLLSGGSVANFNCMAVARTVKAPANVSAEGLYGSKPLTVYVSEEGHSSFDKAVDMLGIGRNYLRKVPVDEELRIDLEALERLIDRDRNAGFHPICAIGVAGTTNNGAVDDLDGVADICEKHDLWYHVDAAYGGPAARVEGVSHLFSGLERADSLVVNPHKWLYVPFEAGGALVRNPEHLRATFSTIPDYLRSDRGDDGRTDLMEYNLPLTKEFKALKVWMTLKTYGARRLRESIRRDIDRADMLALMVEEHPRMEMMAPAPLSIVCFRYNPGGKDPDELDRLNERIAREVEQDGRIFLTATRICGRAALRTCFINHRTREQDVRLIVEVVDELGAG
ncbi:MAG: aminotransferase class I/II-fold pyridoxal phosphate-dependent enzyme [Balneolaceae bacterium]|nr:aminotransferase class I/II-fold pyridoxal phosphate-dependent enzyme [Balneolaceae bacterium]